MKITACRARIDAIVVPDGRRALDREKVAQLADSMAATGLINPITLTVSARLIAGAHRLAAAQLLGWNEIDARMWDAGEIDAQIIELEENVIRSELSELDISRAWARLKELYLARNPERAAGGVRPAIRTSAAPGSGKDRRRHRLADKQTKSQDSGFCSAGPSFAAEMAEKTGKSESTIKAGVKLAEDLDHGIDEIVKETPVANNASALRRIADAGDPEAQANAAREEVERAALPKRGNKASETQNQKPETVVFNGQVSKLLASGRTIEETAKELGCTREKVQRAKRTLGLSTQPGRDPLKRIADQATEFCDVLSDLMACAEPALADVTTHQVKEVTKSLEGLVKTVRGIQERLKKEAAKG